MTGQSLPRLSKPRRMIVSILFLIAVAPACFAQTRTLGLMLNDQRSWPGYTLLAPSSYNVAYLIDNEGRELHRWEGVYPPGLAVYMLENGNLLRTGRVDQGTPEGGGRIEEVDWDGNIVWRLDDHGTPYKFHHDVVQLPNGNILALASERKSIEEAIQAGRDPALLSQDMFVPDLVLELQPNGAGTADIVWEWHFWDHMSSNRPGDWSANGRPVSKDTTDPGKMNINFLMDGQADWLHCNGIDYHPGLDQIAISSRHAGEFYVISHATVDYQNIEDGIEAARGPAGDFLYRWGNPASYGANQTARQRLFGPHDIAWIPEGLPGAGHFLVFNNGLNRPAGRFSTVEELAPPLLPDNSYGREPDQAFGPDSALWVYRAPRPRDFYSAFMSGAQRLPNGNTLIAEAAGGTLFEVTAEKETVWLYVNPVGISGPMEQGSPALANPVFLCRRYATDFPGFGNRELKPGNPVEKYPVSDIGDPPAVPTAGLSVYPNPVSETATVRVTLPVRGHLSLAVCDHLGRVVRRLADGDQEQGSHAYRLNTGGLAAGFYLLRLIVDGRWSTHPLLVSW